MTHDIVYDLELYPNVFTLAAEHAHLPIRWSFEISPWRDDSRAIVEWCQWIAGQGGRLVGFNNVGFDYPVLHTLLRMGKADARTLYDKAMAIIGSQSDDDGEGRWMHSVKPTDRIVPQVDLFRVWHFDNKARATSLKVIEFNMRMDDVSDLPFPVGTELTQEQAAVLKAYNAHDVAATKRFYHESVEMIRFREELCVKYPGRDWLNFSDSKIGKEFVIMRLEEAGISCYDYGPNGRQPRQTPRPVIHLKDAIPSWIQFDQPEFQRVHQWLLEQTITETKGVFTDLTATLNGFTFVFGTGGIHGSVENRIIEATDQRIIESVDVTSMYPNIAIVNRLYPQHLGERFCDIYKDLYEQRKKYPKGTAENGMIKLGLNSVYGDSNNRFSAFYDPLFTMRITLSGQLMLCKLAEMLLTVPTVELCMGNTDGLEYTVHPQHAESARQVCRAWEMLTGLRLEHARYKRMFIRDCNNYISEYEE